MPHHHHPSHVTSHIGSYAHYAWQWITPIKTLITLSINCNIILKTEKYKKGMRLAFAIHLDFMCSLFWMFTHLWLTLLKKYFNAIFDKNCIKLW
jgi:hypothetical protein